MIVSPQRGTVWNNFSVYWLANLGSNRATDNIFLSTTIFKLDLAHTRLRILSKELRRLELEANHFHLEPSSIVGGNLYSLLYTCHNSILNHKGDFTYLVHDARIYVERIGVACGRTERIETSQTSILTMVHNSKNKEGYNNIRNAFFSCNESRPTPNLSFKTKHLCRTNYSKQASVDMFLNKPFPW
jgi:hypothetical protein